MKRRSRVSYWRGFFAGRYLEGPEQVSVPPVRRGQSKKAEERRRRKRQRKWEPLLWEEFLR